MHGIVFFDIPIFDGTMVDDDAFALVALYLNTCGCGHAFAIRSSVWAVCLAAFLESVNLTNEDQVAVELFAALSSLILMAWRWGSYLGYHP